MSLRAESVTFWGQCCLVPLLGCQTPEGHASFKIHFPISFPIITSLVKLLTLFTKFSYKNCQPLNSEWLIYYGAAAILTMEFSDFICSR